MRSHCLLVIGLGLAALAFVTLACLLWINRGGEHALLLFLKAVCGPLLVTLFLISYDLARPLEVVRATVPITFYETSGNLFANRTLSANEEFPRVPTGYFLTEATFGTWARAQKDPPTVDQKYEIYLDSLEAGFIQWLAMHYLMHWQVETKRQLMGFEGSHGTVRGTIEGAEKKPLLFNVADLRTTLHNRILDAQDFGAFSRIALPSDARVSHHRDDRIREITIETANIRFVVTIEFQSQWKLEGLSGNKAVKKILEILGPEAGGTYYVTDFIATPKRLRRWASRTEDEMNWARGMIDFYKSDFEWQRQP